MLIKNIVKELKSLANHKAIEGMARFGINPQNTYGVSIPHLRKMAKKIGKNHRLAQNFGKQGFTKQKFWQE